MPSIFNNRTDETKLSSNLRTYFPSYQHIDVATRYFAPRGWVSLGPPVRENFESGDVKGPITHILAGMVSPVRHDEVIDQLRSEISPNDDEFMSLREHVPQVCETLKAHLCTQPPSEIPTVKGRENLQFLRELVKLGAVEARIYTR